MITPLGAVASQPLSQDKATVAIGGGHSLFVRDWGEGPPVLFLSGWGMDSSSWAPTMTALNGHGLRAVAYDRRGHGRSTDPGRLGYDLLADDLAEILWAKDLRDVTIVAHSGAVGEVLRYLARYGDARLAHLVLVGAAGPCLHQAPDNPDGLTLDAIEAILFEQRTNLAGWIEANLEPFAPQASRPTLDRVAQAVMQCSQRALLDYQREIFLTDMRDEARAVRRPVAIIHGDRDVSAPLARTGDRFAELIPDARLIVYPGAAHGLMLTHVEQLTSDIASCVRARMHEREER